MERISKRPEIRRQELVDIALSLFIEKGYEAVSVRDILKVVNGHPGMFYYYFSSKQEIYAEAMRQLIQKQVEKREIILSDKSKSSLARLKMFINEIQDSISSFYKTFSSLDSMAYQTVVLLDMLSATAESIAQLMLELYDEGIIPPDKKLNKETAHSMALFMIYGCYGLVHNNESKNMLENKQFLIPFIASFTGIHEDLLS